MLTTLTILVALGIALRFLPVRRSMLNEGVFNRTEEGFGLYGGRYQCFYFDHYCRNCLENPETRVDWESCHVAVRSTARMLESYRPKKGDSIKITGWKNVFGRVLLYRIVQTNFAIETHAWQMREYEEEMAAYREAHDRNRAMREGVTLEEYRRRSAIRSQRFEKQWDKLDREGFLKDAAAIGKIEIGCTEHLKMDTWEYAVRGEFCCDDEAAAHLAACVTCKEHLGKMRERYLETPKTVLCFSDEELVGIAATGRLPSSRMRHTVHCYRCLVDFNFNLDAHLKANGPDCLTQDDQHAIHSTGILPESVKAHVASCERCIRTAKNERNRYIDKTIPVPPMPKRRLTSVEDERAKTA